MCMVCEGVRVSVCVDISCVCDVRVIQLYFCVGEEYLCMCVPVAITQVSL